ncbi:MAG: hypothetical protein ACLFPF_09445 [Halanaerobiales bacterium]
MPDETKDTFESDTHLECERKKKRKKNKNENKSEISDDIYMQSGIVDQVNYSHQSNMTLCAYSVITQSFSTIKININEETEDENNG